MSPPCQASDGTWVDFLFKWEGMYHSVHSDLICTLALSHSDLLTQVRMTLVKVDYPTHSGHPGLSPPTTSMDIRKKRKKVEFNHIVILNWCSCNLFFSEPPRCFYRFYFLRKISQSTTAILSLTGYVTLYQCRMLTLWLGGINMHMSYFI